MNECLERLRQFSEDFQKMNGDIEELMKMGYRVTKLPQEAVLDDIDNLGITRIITAANTVMTCWSGGFPK